MKAQHSITRRQSRQIMVGNVPVGGGAPISVQSMTNTETRDVEATVAQIQAIQQAGADIVRVSVPTMDAAVAFGKIKKRVNKHIKKAKYDRAPEDALPADVPHLQEFCKALLTLEPSKRLGVDGGFQKLKAHRFFGGLDWQRLAAGDLEAPIKPSSTQMNAPTSDQMDLDGLDAAVADIDAALTVDVEEWKAEIPLIEEWFEKIGDGLPTSMRDELEALKLRLGA